MKTFTVGMLVRIDERGNSYPAKILKIRPDSKELFVHYQGWNQRYDRWVGFSCVDSCRTSPRSKSQSYKNDKTYNVGDEVLGRWTDGKLYACTIKSISKDKQYTVEFYDGAIYKLSEESLGVLTPSIKEELERWKQQQGHCKTTDLRRRSLSKNLKLHATRSSISTSACKSPDASRSNDDQTHKKTTKYVEEIKDDASVQRSRPKSVRSELLANICTRRTRSKSQALKSRFTRTSRESACKKRVGIDRRIRTISKSELKDKFQESTSKRPSKFDTSKDCISKYTRFGKKRFEASKKTASSSKKHHNEVLKKKPRHDFRAVSNNSSSLEAGCEKMDDAKSNAADDATKDLPNNSTNDAHQTVLSDNEMKTHNIDDKENSSDSHKNCNKSGTKSGESQGLSPVVTEINETKLLGNALSHNMNLRNNECEKISGDLEVRDSKIECSETKILANDGNVAECQTTENKPRDRISICSSPSVSSEITLNIKQQSTDESVFSGDIKKSDVLSLSTDSTSNENVFTFQRKSAEAFSSDLSTPDPTTPLDDVFHNTTPKLNPQNPPRIRYRLPPNLPKTTMLEERPKRERKKRKIYSPDSDDGLHVVVDPKPVKKSRASKSNTSRSSSVNEESSSNVLPSSVPASVHAQRIVSGILSSVSLRDGIQSTDSELFYCNESSCKKSFRKLKLLQYHQKYYHTVQSINPPKCNEKTSKEPVSSPTKIGEVANVSFSPEAYVKSEPQEENPKVCEEVKDEPDLTCNDSDADLNETSLKSDVDKILAAKNETPLMEKSQISSTDNLFSKPINNDMQIEIVEKSCLRKVLKLKPVVSSINSEDKEFRPLPRLSFADLTARLDLSQKKRRKRLPGIKRHLSLPAKVSNKSKCFTRPFRSQSSPKSFSSTFGHSSHLKSKLSDAYLGGNSENYVDFTKMCCVCHSAKKQHEFLQCDICLCYQHYSCVDLPSKMKSYVCRTCKGTSHIRKSENFPSCFKVGDVLPSLSTRNSNLEIWMHVTNQLAEDLTITIKMTEVIERLLDIMKNPGHPEHHKLALRLSNDLEKYPTSEVSNNKQVKNSFTNSKTDVDQPVKSYSLEDEEELNVVDLILELEDEKSSSRIASPAIFDENFKSFECFSNGTAQSPSKADQFSNDNDANILVDTPDKIKLEITQIAKTASISTNSETSNDESAKITDPNNSNEKCSPPNTYSDSLKSPSFTDRKTSLHRITEIRKSIVSQDTLYSKLPPDQLDDKSTVILDTRKSGSRKPDYTSPVKNQNKSPSKLQTLPEINTDELLSVLHDLKPLDANSTSTEVKCKQEAIESRAPHMPRDHSYFLSREKVESPIKSKKPEKNKVMFDENRKDITFDVELVQPPKTISDMINRLAVQLKCRLDVLEELFPSIENGYASALSGKLNFAEFVTKNPANSMYLLMNDFDKLLKLLTFT